MFSLAAVFCVVINTQGPFKPPLTGHLFHSLARVKNICIPPKYSLQNTRYRKILFSENVLCDLLCKQRQPVFSYPPKGYKEQ